MPDLTDLLNKVHHSDCFDLLRCIPDGTIDLILTDPPYAVHEAEWDKPIDIDRMWTEFKRVIKPRGAIVITATMRFAVDLITSNREWFKYDWVWTKTVATDFLNARNKPMRAHEHILVFSPGTTANKSERRMNYYPQVEYTGQKWIKQRYAATAQKSVFGTKGRAGTSVDWIQEGDGFDYPTTVLHYPNPNIPGRPHPNMKPLPLFEYLLKSYTTEGDIVLDPFMGSGTTALAARNTGRRFIAGDSDATYCAIARDRLRMPFEPREHVKESAPMSDLPLFAAIGD